MSHASCLFGWCATTRLLFRRFFSFFYHAPATTEIYTLSLHDALPISRRTPGERPVAALRRLRERGRRRPRSEEHTSELQSLTNLVCRLLLEKKKTRDTAATASTRIVPTCSGPAMTRTTPRKTDSQYRK